jgi:hypothetical protein
MKIIKAWPIYLGIILLFTSFEAPRTIFGHWQQIKLTESNLDGSNKVVTIRKETDSLSKVVKPDGTFEVYMGSKVVLSGTYVIVGDKIDEKVTFALNDDWKNFRNVMLYRLSGDKMHLKYLLFNNKTVMEEVWKRVD